MLPKIYRYIMQPWYHLCIIQISGFRSWLHLHCIVHTVLILYYIPLQYVCVCHNTVFTLYYYISIFTYFPAVFFHSTLSVIIPYSVKADIALIHAEGSKLIRDRYLELCQKPTPCLFINLFNVGLRGLVLVCLDDPSNQLQT